MPRSNSPEAEANFASYPFRRLDAEVLIDAINQITGTSDLYTSPIPEPFTYIPQDMPAVAIADGSITSPFLALFGRSARATGLESERNNRPTPDQWLYLLNSSDIQRKLEQGPALQAIIGFGRRPSAEILEELYLTILSRFPTLDEVKTIETYAREQAAKPPPAPKTAGTNTVVGGSTGTKAGRTDLASSALTITNSPRTNPPAAGLAGSTLITTNAERTGRVGPVGSLGPAGKRSDKTVTVKRREDWLDIAWSLINSDEFWYRH
jgi:hypothetical protein